MQAHICNNHAGAHVTGLGLFFTRVAVVVLLA